jgi:hypothetical protein
LLIVEITVQGVQLLSSQIFKTTESGSWSSIKHAFILNHLQSLFVVVNGIASLLFSAHQIAIYLSATLESLQPQKTTISFSCIFSQAIQVKTLESIAHKSITEAT